MQHSFIEQTRAYLDSLANRLENAGLEVDFDDLTLSFSDVSETFFYLFKVHKTNKELWISSPVSGGQRFQWNDVTQQWLNIRTGEELEKKLEEELTTYRLTFKL